MLEVRGVSKRYPAGGTFIEALSEVSLALLPGSFVSLVGESGCGKTTLARVLMGLVAPDAGEVLLDGAPMRAGRFPARFRRSVQMVFQDPYASLNPRMKVADIIAEPLDIHRVGAGEARARRVVELLARVGLDGDAGEKLPREFSGGQRQRIAIARALAIGPRYLVADEPVSALDVSVQAQVLNLLLEIQRAERLGVLFISHDLRVVRAVSDRVMVMRGGRVVEAGPTEAVYTRPRHPYTKKLLSSMPVVEWLDDPPAADATAGGAGAMDEDGGPAGEGGHWALDESTEED